MVAEPALHNNGDGNGNGKSHLVPAWGSYAPPAPARVGEIEQPREQNLVSVGTVLHAIRRWWKWCLPLGALLATTAAGIVYYYFEPTFRARAWLHIQEEAPYLAFRHGNGSQRFVNTQRELLRSPLVLEQVLADPQVGKLELLAEREDPVEWLRNQLDIRSVGNSEVFEVAFAAADPQAAQQIVNAVVNIYLKFQRSSASEQTLEILRRLAQQREARESVVRTMRENVRQLARTVAGAGGGDGKAIVFDHPLADLRDKLTDAEVQRELLQAELAAVQHTPWRSAAAASLTAMVDQHPEVVRLQHEVNDLAARLARVEAAQRPGRTTRQFADLRTALNQRRQAHQQMREQVQTQLHSQAMAQAQVERDQYIRTQFRRIESLRLSEDLFRKKYEAQVSRMEDTGDESLKLELAKSALRREEDVLQRISDRAMALSTEMEAPWRVRPLFAAKAPQAPIEKQPYKRMGLLAAAGFFLPFALAVCWEGYVRRVADVHQLRRSRLPVVGEVAALPLRRSLPQSRLSSNRSGWYASLFEESIHSVRTGLHLNTSLASLRVLTVASAVKREGKTSFAAQLAVSYAKTTDGKVLLIDGDMRSPDLHTVFETSNDAGLASVLAGAVTAEQAIVPVLEDRLYLLPAGVLHQSPHELVARGAFQRLVSELREQYDTILIDTPPILAAGEALALAAASDATVVCAMQNKSCSHQIMEAVQRLEMAGANPIGLVLNGVPVSRYAYTYGHYS